MRIVFISHLSPVASTGPNYSVPGRIEGQSYYDSVYWINLTRVVRDEWKSKPYFHQSTELGLFTLTNIEKQFPNIDLVVFEGFYNMEQVRLSKELRKRHIPYIIVPRSSLTRQALHNHSWLKKKIAHWFYFNSYCRHALAIQFLTKRELEDSGTKWCKHNIIIPNGINIPTASKKEFGKKEIHAVFVGRIDIYQKGIDVLLDACGRIKEEIRKGSFLLTIYGPKIIDYERVNSQIESLGIEDFVRLGGEILGAEKEQVLLDADLFVLTSRFEGHPMGLIEALAYGLPVLVSPGSNMADEITRENAGWVCETNADSIEKSLLHIFQERDKFWEKGNNARQLAARYDWRLLAKQFHDEIEKIK